MIHISLIVPARHAVDMLPRSLAAIRESSYPVCECIVVNDDSTDETAAVARAVAGVTVLEAPGSPKGPANARNQGAAAAKGDIS